MWLAVVIVVVIVAAVACGVWILLSRVGDSIAKDVVAATEKGIDETVREGLAGTDPKEVAQSLSIAVSMGTISTEQAMQRMASLELARSATPASQQFFKDVLFRMSGESADNVCFYARLVMQHVHALDELGRFAEADELLDPALAGLRQHEPLFVGRCLHQRGKLLHRLGRFDEALMRFDNAEPMLREYAAPAEWTACLANRATARLARGLVADGLREFENILPLIRQHLQSGEAANALLNAGILFNSQGNFTRCLETCKEALGFLGEQDEPQLRIRCLLEKGTALRAIGRYDESLQAFDLAISLSRSGGLSELLGDCLTQRALTLSLRGDFAAAANTLDDALPLLLQKGESTKLAESLEVRGTSRQQLGRHDEALVDFAKALAIYEKRGTIEQVGQCLRGRANSLQRLNRDADALADYERAVLLLRDHGLPRNLATTLVCQGALLVALKEFVQAETCFDKALTVFRREGITCEGITREIATCLLNKAVSLLAQEKGADTVTAYEAIDVACLSQDERLKYHRGYAQALDRVGRKAERLQHLTFARHCFRRTLAQAGIDETSLEFLRQRRIVVDEAFSAALEQDDVLLAFDAVQDGKASLFATTKSRLAVDLPLESDAVRDARHALCDWLRTGAPEETGDLAQAAPVADYLRACRLDRPVPLAGDGVPEHTAAQLLQEVQQSLPSNWALLDFWQFSEAQTFILVVRRDQPIEVVPIASLSPLGDRFLFIEVEQFLNQRRSPYIRRGTHPIPELPPPWEALYSTVFRPVLPYLKGVEGLYIVPHRNWHLVPLHAALSFDPVTGQSKYLSEMYAVAYLPSAAVLPTLPRLDTGALTRKVLSLANPGHGTFQTLPFAEWEAKQLRSRLQSPAARFFAGPEATCDRTNDWGECTLVHFACHGVSNTEFAPLSRLLLRDDFLLADDVMYRRPPLCEGALVILNGCQTAVLDRREVDEAMGLMNAFLLRGAGMVLATLWNVSDHCAAEMVTAFVTQLVEHPDSPAKALVMAQRHVRQLRSGEIEQRCGDLKDRLQTETPRHEADHLDNLRFSLAPRNLSNRPETEAGFSDELPYDDPGFWSAFVLIGRIT